MNEEQELAQKLKPHIIKWLPRVSTSSGGSSGGSSLPAKWQWSKIDFAGSSLADIAYRSHADLSNRDADDHRQYLMQAGREGYIYMDALAQVRDPSGINRRGQFKMDTNGFEISSYDADLLAYKSAFLDGSDIYLRPNGSSSPALYTRVASTGEMSVANDSDTEHHFGRAYVGYTGHADNAAFGHIDWTGATNYTSMQDNSGDSYFNAPLGRTVYVRNGNVDRFAVSDDMLWYSGMPSIRTDNYVSQLTGMHFTYTGEIDARYMYTDQLHAKAFIADLEQALAGLQIITKSVTILDQEFTAPFPGQALPITVKDLPSAHGMDVFVSGDTINVRHFNRHDGQLDIADCWGVVTSRIPNGNGTQTWTFTRSDTPTYNTIAHRNTQTQSSSSDNAPTVLKPIGTTSGDILIATLVFPVAPSSITQPSGFTLLRIETSASITMYIWRRIADGSEPSSFVWSLGSNINYSAMVTAYSNPYGLFPIDASNSQSNTSSTSMTAPAVSARSAKDMLLFVAATRNVRATPPSGMTERADAGTTNAGVYLADLLLSAGGATGTKTATLATASDSVAALIALVPSWSALGSTAGAVFPLDTISPDAVVLDYGTSGNGYAEVNAIDGLYGVNSPYYQIVTWTGHPATGKTLKARLGNLAGVTDTTLNPTGFGLYTDNAYLKGDLLTGGGYVRIYQASGINLQESVGAGLVTTPNQRAIQWWTDITNMTLLSLVIDSTKVTSGLNTGWNRNSFIATPTNGVVADMTIQASGTNIKNASIILRGDSTSLGSLASIFASADNITLAVTALVTISGEFLIDNIAAGNATEGWRMYGATTSTARGFDNVRIGVESGTPRVIWEDNTYTQWIADNNAGVFRIFNPGASKLTLDTSGNLAVTGTMKTAAGVTFDIGGFNTLAVAQTGYITAVIGGVTRRLLVG